MTSLSDCNDSGRGIGWFAVSVGIVEGGRLTNQGQVNISSADVRILLNAKVELRAKDTKVAASGASHHTPTSRLSTATFASRGGTTILSRWTRREARSTMP